MYIRVFAKKPSHFRRFTGAVEPFPKNWTADCPKGPMTQGVRSSPASYHYSSYHEFMVGGGIRGF
jgi:hypothetical protein